VCVLFVYADDDKLSNAMAFDLDIGHDGSSRLVIKVKFSGEDHRAKSYKSRITSSGVIMHNAIDKLKRV